MRNRYLGEHIRNYQERRLTIKAKTFSLAALYSGLTVSTVLMEFAILPTVILIVVGGAVTVHIVMLKTAGRTNSPE